MMQVEPESVNIVFWRRSLQGKDLDLASLSPQKRIESVLEAIMIEIIERSVLPKLKSTRLDIQVQSGPYRIDSVIYGGNRPIAIEVDGHDWHEKNAKQAAHDRRKDRYLQMQGYFIARFTGQEIWLDHMKIKNELLQICQAVGIEKI